jgi:hypothetical protein
MMESLVWELGLAGSLGRHAGPLLCAVQPVCLRYLVQQTIEWDSWDTKGSQPFRIAAEALEREVIG